MKKFILGAVAAVALLVCSAAESNAQFPVARGVRAAARGAVRVATPGIGPIYGPRVYAPRVYAPRVYAGPVYPVYRAPVVVARPYYGGWGYGGYGGWGYGGYGYRWAPGVSVGVGRVGVNVGF